MFSINLVITIPGKSTLMISLLRMVELSEGSILIDGQDIRALGLTKLRKNVAVIPQDPVLFSGTIRSNLDPFSEFSDKVLLETLERAGLYATNQSSTSLSSMGLSCVQSLEDAVSEGGINFSVGQRQLLVISRALLRGARIVIMDEATAVNNCAGDVSVVSVADPHILYAFFLPGRRCGDGCRDSESHENRIR